MYIFDDTTTLFDLVYAINPDRKDICENIDVYLPNKLDWNTLGMIIFNLNYKSLPDMMPNTKKKINNIVVSALDEISGSWHILRSLGSWLDKDTTDKATKKWVESEDTDTSWIGFLSCLEKEMGGKIISKMVRIYNSNKSKYHIKNIEKIFKLIPTDEIKAACNILAESSPAVAASLLSREDLPEEYIIIGLKSISKLSRQRKISIEIDFQMLKNLGPRSRLDAMKQLLGILNIYMARELKFPFKTVPTKEEVESFLFPCSLKYNEEVAEIVKKYEELINNTKSKEVSYYG